MNNRLHADNAIAAGALSKSPYENLTRNSEEHAERGHPNQYDITSVISRHVYVEKTLVINPQRSPENEKVTHPPQSPRTRIRTTVRDQYSKDQGELSNQLAILNDYETVEAIQLRNTSPNIQRRKFLTPSQQLNKFSNLNNLVMSGQTMGSTSQNESPHKFILPLNDSSGLTDLMLSLEKEFSSSLSAFRNADRSSELRKEDSWISDEYNNDLPESERDLHLSITNEGSTKDECIRTSLGNEIRRESDRTESFIRHKTCDSELNKIRAEKSTWLSVMSKIKSGVHNIEQQEEEILREVGISIRELRTKICHNLL